MNSAAQRLSAKARGVSGAKRPRPGIVHFGVGAFFRAHGAIYISDAVEKSGGDWGIIGVSLKRPNQRDLLAPQDFIYTAIEKSKDGLNTSHIDCLLDVLVAPENPAKVLATLGDPAIKIVTLTITEKGYCLDPATGKLDFSNPDIIADLQFSDAPHSALGYLLRGLEIRKENGLRPFTVLSCDNIPSNGHLVKRALLELADRKSSELGDWIESECCFPSTMVDRIVPASTQKDIDECASLTGYLDMSPVVHEPFCQWVVEDDFVDDDYPDIGSCGAQLVDDVAPYEMMKLRCLNGSHSTLAYLGYLAGHKTIYDTVSDALFSSLVKAMWHDEIIPTLQPLDGVNYAQYCDELLSRFCNPAIQHATWQIAMDGSQKLPQRLLATLEQNIKAGRHGRLIALAIAGWMRYVSGTDDAGNKIDVRDALWQEISLTVKKADKAPVAIVEALLGMKNIFPPAIRADKNLTDLLVEIYTSIENHGVRSTVEKYLQLRSGETK